MKNSRQEKILELISEREIETQEELSELLRKSGYNVTQATVSRDIRELQLVKTVSPNKTAHYTAGKSDHSSNDRSVHRELLGSALKKVDFAGNITVVKTLAGMAQGIGAAIDSMHLDGIVGSVAGDDTLIIIARSEAAAEALKNDIEKLG